MGFVKNIQDEIRIIRERDPAIHSSWEVFLYPSFKVMLHYRLAHKLYIKRHYFLARWVSGHTGGQRDALSGSDIGRYRQGAGKAASHCGQ